MSPIESYLKHLDGIFQKEPLFFTTDRKDLNVPGAVSMVYENIPEGCITGVSWGLSRLSHPDWKYGRPELSITVESKDRAWGDVAGFLANEMRGTFAFNYGQIIDFGEQISDESEMRAFFIFAPSIYEKEDYLNIDIGLDYKINIAGLYPIYKEEIDTISKIGLEVFMQHPGYDLYSVKRPRIMS